MGDINEYVLSKKISACSSSLGMRELITDRHREKGPATTRRNQKIKAMDGIWGTTVINIYAGGYLPFNQGPKSYPESYGSVSPTQKTFATRNTPFDPQKPVNLGLTTQKSRRDTLPERYTSQDNITFFPN